MFFHVLKDYNIFPTKLQKRIGSNFFSSGKNINYIKRMDNWINSKPFIMTEKPQLRLVQRNIITDNKIIFF